MLILTSDYKALNREPRSSQLFSRWRNSEHPSTKHGLGFYNSY
jgi:hypothetical protein